MTQITLPELSSPSPCAEASRLQANISDFLQNGAVSAQQASSTERTALLASARALVAGLETPQETNVRISWWDPTTAAALRLLLEYKVFPHMVGIDSDDSPKTTAVDLAAKCGDKHGLIRRLLKRVANSSYVKEVGPDEYVPTPLTWHFAQDTNAGYFKSRSVELPCASVPCSMMRQLTTIGTATTRSILQAAILRSAYSRMNISLAVTHT